MRKVVLTIIIVICLLAITTSAVQAETILRRTLGAKTFSDYDIVVSCLQQRDVEAVARLILLDRCRLFEPGERVSVVDISVWRGLLKVRPRGEIGTWWINEKCISRSY